jgi:hypothetical protein
MGMFCSSLYIGISTEISTGAFVLTAFPPPEIIIAAFLMPSRNEFSLLNTTRPEYSQPLVLWASFQEQFALICYSQALRPSSINVNASLGELSGKAGSQKAMDLRLSGTRSKILSRRASASDFGISRDSASAIGINNVIFPTEGRSPFAKLLFGSRKYLVGALNQVKSPIKARCEWMEI